jgi:CBS domain-containing protein
MLDMENVTASTVSDLMIPQVDTIALDEPVLTARRRMESQTSRSLIVVDGDRPVGVIQWRGLAQLEGSTLIRDVMQTEFPIVRPEMSLNDLRDRLADQDVDFDHIPVVDEGGTLIGEVPRGSITKREVAADASTQPVVSGPDSSTSAGPAIHLEEGMKVVGVTGSKLGSVDQVELNSEGYISHFTVKYGLLGRSSKRLPADVIRDVSDNTVNLTIDSPEFKMLADVGEEVV